MNHKMNICHDCFNFLTDSAPMVCVDRMEGEDSYDEDWYCVACGEESHQSSDCYCEVENDLTDIIGWILNLIITGGTPA